MPPRTTPAGLPRAHAATLARFWRLLAPASMVVGLLTASSPALASNGWSTPVAIDPGGHLMSVSCPSASFCVAVDQAGRVVTFNGSSWSAPARIDTEALASVSCPSALFCVAVDNAGRALMFNGGSWSAPVLLPGLVGVGGSAVSCASPSFCVALSTIRREQPPPTLPPPSPGVPPPPPPVPLPPLFVPAAVTFNGSSWSAPAPIGVPWAVYGSPPRGLPGLVSCPSTSFCAAITEQPATSNGTPPISSTFNGTSWTAPAGIGGAPPLLSVSCPSASFCVAVGLGGGVVTFNSGSWSAPGSLPGATAEAGYNVVSCASASFCVALSDVRTSCAEFLPAAWTFNGNSWSAPTTLNSCSPGQYYYRREQRMSVSCPSASFCAAVDFDGNAYTYGSAAGSTTSRVKAALSSTLAISGRSASIAQLLKHGGYTASFTAPSAGRLVIDWYLVPKGAHLARAKKMPVLVARASVVFHKARRAKVKIALTSNGRRLLKSAKHLVLTAKSSFVPAGGRATSITKTFTLKR